MLKKSSIITLLFALLLNGCGTAITTPTAGYETYLNDVHKIFFRYPQDLKVEQLPEDSFIIGPKENGPGEDFIATFSIREDRTFNALLSFYEKMSEMRTAAVSKKDFIINELSAREYIFSIEGTEKDKSYTIIVGNGETSPAYVFDIVSGPSADEEKLLAIVQSFKRIQ